MSFLKDDYTKNEGNNNQSDPTKETEPDYSKTSKLEDHETRKKSESNLVKQQNKRNDFDEDRYTKQYGNSNTDYKESVYDDGDPEAEDNLQHFSQHQSKQNFPYSSSKNNNNFNKSNPLGSNIKSGGNKPKYRDSEDNTNYYGKNTFKKNNLYARNDKQFLSSKYQNSSIRDKEGDFYQKESTSNYLKNTNEISHQLKNFLARKFNNFQSIEEIITNQNGSRKFQQSLEFLDENLIEEIYNQIKRNFLKMFSHVYGNYFCQKLFFCLNGYYRKELISLLINRLYKYNSNLIYINSLKSIFQGDLSEQDQSQIIVYITKHINFLIQDENCSILLETIITKFDKAILESLEFYLITISKDLIKSSHGMYLINKIILTNGNYEEGEENASEDDFKQGPMNKEKPSLSKCPQKKDSQGKTDPNSIKNSYSYRVFKLLILTISRNFLAFSSLRNGSLVVINLISKLENSKAHCRLINSFIKAINFSEVPECSIRKYSNKVIEKLVSFPLFTEKFFQDCVFTEKPNQTKEDIINSTLFTLCSKFRGINIIQMLFECLCFERKVELFKYIDTLITKSTDFIKPRYLNIWKETMDFIYKKLFVEKSKDLRITKARVIQQEKTEMNKRKKLLNFNDNEKHNLELNNEFDESFDNPADNESDHDNREVKPKQEKANERKKKHGNDSSLLSNNNESSNNASSRGQHECRESKSSQKKQQEKSNQKQKDYENDDFLFTRNEEKERESKDKKLDKEGEKDNKFNNDDSADLSNNSFKQEELDMLNKEMETFLIDEVENDTNTNNNTCNKNEQPNEINDNNGNNNNNNFIVSNNLLIINNNNNNNNNNNSSKNNYLMNNTTGTLSSSTATYPNYTDSTNLQSLSDKNINLNNMNFLLGSNIINPQGVKGEGENCYYTSKSINDYNPNTNNKLMPKLSQFSGQSNQSEKLKCYSNNIFNPGTEPCKSKFFNLFSDSSKMIMNKHSEGVNSSTSNNINNQNNINTSMSGLNVNNSNSKGFPIKVSSRESNFSQSQQSNVPVNITNNLVFENTINSQPHQQITDNTNMNATSNSKFKQSSSENKLVQGNPQSNCPVILKSSLMDHSLNDHNNNTKTFNISNNNYINNNNNQFNDFHNNNNNMNLVFSNFPQQTYKTSNICFNKQFDNNPKLYYSSNTVNKKNIGVFPYSESNNNVNNINSNYYCLENKQVPKHTDFDMGNNCSNKHYGFEHSVNMQQNPLSRGDLSKVQPKNLYQIGNLQGQYCNLNQIGQINPNLINNTSVFKQTITKPSNQEKLDNFGKMNNYKYSVIPNTQNEVNYQSIRDHNLNLPKNLSSQVNTCNNSNLHYNYIPTIDKVQQNNNYAAFNVQGGLNTNQSNPNSNNQSNKTIGSTQKGEQKKDVNMTNPKVNPNNYIN